MFKSQIIIILLALSLFACQDTNRESKVSAAVTKPTDADNNLVSQSSGSAEAAKLIAENPMESAVSKVQAIDTAKQLIRTAGLKFRAKKVLPATLQIERIAQENWRRTGEWMGFTVRSGGSVEFRFAVGADSDWFVL